MRKCLLLFVMGLVAQLSFGQSEPVITLTAEVDGQSRTLELGSAVPDNHFTVDWGDGNIVEGGTAAAAYDGWDNAVSLVGVPLGQGNIKIYATGGVNHFDCVSKVGGTGITALDVTKAVDLTDLSANGNKLTTLDLSKCVNLTKVDASNNSLESINLTGLSALTSLTLTSNKLTAFDGSQVPGLTTLYLSKNPMSSLDLSNNTKLKNIYLLDMGLESLTVGNNTTDKLYMSVNNNKLTSLDLAGATGLANGRLFAMNNQLTELKYQKIGTANLSGNKFTLATLPTANITTLTYAPQQPMEIGDIAETIDLSAQNNITGLAAGPQATTYAWYLEDGTALVTGTDYTEEAGKFTFVKVPTAKVYCTMTTAALPKFTGANIFKTTLATVTATTGVERVSSDVDDLVEVYGLDGVYMGKQPLGTLKHGVYVVRLNNKTVKVVR